MGLLENISRYRDERHRLFELRWALERNVEAFHKTTSGMKTRSVEFQEAVAHFSHEAEEIIAEIAELETAQMMRRATSWRVPVPSPPYATDDSTETWRWHSAHGCHYLTDAGISMLRRQVYQEWEMWSKPWLSGLAIIISVISLAISLLKS